MKIEEIIEELKKMTEREKDSIREWLFDEKIKKIERETEDISKKLRSLL